MAYDFQIVRKGYNPDEVDAYIEELENQLNEYKDKSSTINKAIINAQIAADNIIKAAHSETEKILSQAKKEAVELKQSTINQIKYLKLNIANQKNLINNFRKDYEFLTEKYLNPLVTSDTDKVFDKLTEIEEKIDEIVSPPAEVISSSVPDNSHKIPPRRPEKKRYRKEEASFETKPAEKQYNSQNESEDYDPYYEPSNSQKAESAHSTTLTAEEKNELLS